MVLAIGGAAVVAAGWLFVVRNRGLFVEPSETRRIVIEAASRYRTMDMLPLAEVVSGGKLRELVREANITGPLRSEDPRMEALADLVSQFVERRFVAGSSTDYREWRESQGYAWADREWLEGVWGIGRDYSIIVGEAYPEGAPLAQIFDEYYQAALQYGDGANRPAAVATSPEGRCIATAILTRDQPDRAPLTCDLGFDLWHGATNGTARSWWRPPHSTEELIQREGAVLCADVGLVVEFADRSRRPVVVTATWDSAVSRWTLQHLCMYNFPPEQMGRLSAFDY